MTNREMAALFSELADIMEIAGEDHFKIRAYRRAATEISNIKQPIQEMSVARVMEIPGIGNAISEKIESAKSNGTFPTLEKWRQSGFGSLRPLLSLSGMTIRKLRDLVKEKNITSIQELLRIVETGQLNGYEKFSPSLRDELKRFVAKLS